MSHTTSTTDATPTDVLATVATLRKRARAIPKEARGAHFQIARRRIADAAMFATSNTAHAAMCCWEARHHLNECGAD
jgi:hypothetical protein